MKTLGEILRLSTEYLQQRLIERPRRQAEELLSYVLKVPRIELYMQFDRPIIEEELAQLRTFLKRRAEGEPTQYIAGEVEFYSCRIRLNRHVLIPRPETELLVDQVIKEMPRGPLEVWDICTGSGCIGIALKKKRGDCHITLSDISPDALEVARSNAAFNAVDVEILQGDLLQPFDERRADVIVCNPPYVSEQDYRQLDREVREWEPKRALVSGPTGYEFYQRLANDLPRYLKPGAKIYFEIGSGMGEGVKKLFNSPVWSKREVLQDWSSHDRYYKLEIEGLL